jgi:hypothetical protein
MAIARSSSLNHFVVAGKLGRMKKVAKAIRTVTEPSIMKIHLQAKRPRTPFMPLIMPAPISPEKAPEIKDPE